MSEWCGCGGQSPQYVLFDWLLQYAFLGGEQIGKGFQLFLSDRCFHIHVFQIYKVLPG